MSNFSNEKTVYNAAGADQSLSSDDELAWTQEEELKARRKVDSSVLPLLFLGLLVFQLDRMNLASALTAGFAKNIHINQSTINLGNQLMFMGIVVLEIPFNLILQRLGPRKWISAQVCLFGFIAIMQVFVKSRAGFLASRLFLGFAEAGYIPGASYTLSCWYTKRELAKRIAILFFGMFGGNALSPILATGILKLAGRGGLNGWQWLFLRKFEGLFTIFVASMLFLLLPGSPETPRPLLSPGLVHFSLDSPERNGADGARISFRVVWKTIMHYKRWPHYVSMFCVFSTWSPLTTYTPSIILALGFDRTAANALSAIGASLALLVVFCIAYISDKTNKRGLAVILGQTSYLISLIIAHSVQPHVGKWSRWGLWTLVNAFAVGYHPSHNSWVQLNCNDSGERSIAVAMWVMSAISGLMVGTQYFQGGDAPRYQTGLRTMIIMVSVGIAAALVQEVIYFTHNRRVKRSAPTDSSEAYAYVL
ncbi:related to permease of the major facilitator superfamily [Phialocephala subalpina]|uniref:Related to permease of the major facilitator superfamily n=1 Tax=Phialocephala subalpina TaxID=576137 RepID=A0A1L7WL13_9HELO|nr:related to permease of the major facilitator superfamily [Phialocephala subalpina]